MAAVSEENTGWLPPRVAAWYRRRPYGLILIISAVGALLMGALQLARGVNFTAAVVTGLLCGAIVLAVAARGVRRDRKYWQRHGL
jgi:membrane associated rhomboid family serine protease